MSTVPLFAGRYRIESLLGTGGMGTVYQAWDTMGRQAVALKVIRDDLVQLHDELIPRLRREARAICRIDSPHVARVLDFSAPDSSRSQPEPAYLVTELVDGRTLADLLAEQRTLGVQRALNILGQVARALAAVHAGNVVHRDLKPGNVMLTRHRDQPELVKILDFGLAKLLDPSGSSVVTPLGQTFGTAEYISPEQASDRELDHRADIYSAGVLAFEMLSGRPPFRGPLVQVVSAHVYQQPPLLNEVAPEGQHIPSAVEQLVSRCLAKKPEERYADAEELLHAVEQATAAV